MLSAVFSFLVFVIPNREAILSGEYFFFYENQLDQSVRPLRKDMFFRRICLQNPPISGFAFLNFSGAQIGETEPFEARYSLSEQSLNKNG